MLILLTLYRHVHGPAQAPTPPLQVFQKELFDGCCPLHGADPPEFKQFNTASELCCDKPIRRDSSQKCCYLNPGNGSFVPRSYDFASSCCAYPYKEITPKRDGQCVPRPAPAPTAAPAPPPDQQPDTGTR